MILDNRSPWLGQVRLVSRPSLGNIGNQFPQPPDDAKSPGNGCLFMGGRSFLSNATVNANIERAKALGYTDIQELDVPPCVPIEAFQGANCAISSNTPSKYVWACPPKSTTAVQSPASPTASPTTAVLAVGGGVAAAGLALFALLRR